jgi:hypothetical protein
VYGGSHDRGGFLSGPGIDDALAAGEADEAGAPSEQAVHSARTKKPRSRFIGPSPSWPMKM